MKQCPACGFQPTPTNRQLLKLYYREFGDLPVMAMIDRGWMGDVDKDDIPTIRYRIYRFFGVTGQEELDGLLSHSPAGVMCPILDDRGRYL